MFIYELSGCGFESRCSHLDHFCLVYGNLQFHENLQLHEEIIDTIIGETQSRQNSGPGIISKLAVGIRKFLTEDSKNDSLFKGYKDQLAVLENCEYITVPLLNDDIMKNKNIHFIIKGMIKNMQICSNFSHKLVLL